ncbi:hypothetical protein Rcae01_02346 [Novipirellula caenicola]|uniref:Transposase DDE domain-containing protein n=1 Tax=Novipirellula caenicola TaxID=1536901 RepID=A0ABP9VNX8_9BACT
MLQSRWQISRRIDRELTSVHLVLSPLSWARPARGVFARRAAHRLARLEFYAVFKSIALHQSHVRYRQRKLATESLRSLLRYLRLFCLTAKEVKRYDLAGLLADGPP